MVDNVPITAGSGTNIASDDVGGVQYQRVKIAFGADGSAADVQATSRFPVAPAMGSGGNLSATTAAIGTNYTAFASQACLQATIVNDSGVTIEVQQGGAGVAIPVWDQTTFTFFGITNMNQLGVRRKDTSNVQVAVLARWES